MDDKRQRDFYTRMEDNILLRAIRQGLILAIPVILAGSVALLLASLPVDAYQRFLSTFLGGTLLQLFRIIQSSTLGLISLVLLLTISYSYAQLRGCAYSAVTPLVALCAYLVFAHDGVTAPSFDIFTSSWLFNALFVAVTSSTLFVWLCHWHPAPHRHYTSGADVLFNKVASALIPACIVVLLFGLLNRVTIALFGASNFQTAFSVGMSRLFQNLGRNLGSGLLFILLMHVMWFFGIHGSNVLDDVAKGVFGSGMDVNVALAQVGQPPTELVSKTFFDTFVLFGGCGTLLCLVVAILFKGRQRHVRRLAKIAVAPVLFNMNELMLFGLPVVFNPILFIPFVATPLILTVTSYTAMVLGLVPYASQAVEWTTPIFLSGYAATGSVAGSLLQLFNLVLGVLIYLPFLKWSERYSARTARERVQALTQIVQQCELHGEVPVLLDRTDRLAVVANMLAADLQAAVRTGDLPLQFQPQVDTAGHVVAVEALLRWDHPVGGLLYPPLVIALAEEGGFRDALGHCILECACGYLEDMQQRFTQPIRLAVNITAGQLNNPHFVEQVRDILQAHHIPPGLLGLELTEQTALSASKLVSDRLLELRHLGVHLIMDDFGMGHSTLVYLQDNQFDEVKLDGSLVRSLPENQRSADIVSSIVYLSRSMSFRIVAEYVETAQQRAALEALGCQYYQGYLFSPAVPYEAFLVYAAQHGAGTDPGPLE